MQKLQCRSFFIFALIPLKCMRFYMSELAAFRQPKKLAEQIHAIEALKGDADLRKEIEFKTELCTLPAEYDYRLPIGNTPSAFGRKRSFISVCFRPEAVVHRRQLLTPSGRLNLKPHSSIVMDGNWYAVSA